MQWTSGKNAGFSTGASTWLPVAANYAGVNVRSERQNADSLLNYYRKLIRLRKQNAQLRDGDFELMNAGDEDVLCFIRKTGDGRAVLVALNFSGAPKTVHVDLKPGSRVETLLASFSSPRVAELGRLTVGAYGSLVGQVMR
jgi:alpha-glucosidase